MVIKLNYIFTLLATFFLYVSTSAQKGGLSTNSPFESHTYEVLWTVVSPDMNYLTFQKDYGPSSDTLALVSTKQPGRIIFQTPNVYPVSVKFSKKGHVFMSGSSSAKLLKLPDLTPLVWNGIKTAFFMEGYNMIAILKEGIFKIYNEDGILEQEIGDILKLEQKGQRIFYTRKSANNNVLIEWTPSAQKEVFSENDASYHISYLKDHIFFIRISKEGQKNSEIYFVDLSIQKKIKVENAALKALQNIAAVSKLNDGRYLLTLNINEPVVEKTSDVDIWYSNDNNLEKKFFPKEALHYIIWNPENSEMQILDHQRFDKQTDPGNGRYLVAVNSFLHQNYFKQEIEYEMYRYDTLSGNYDFLGSAGLYKIFDYQGKFLLSPNNKNWVLFNIETKEQKVIPLESSYHAYFSKSGDRILFPGKDFLVEYNIAESKLKSLPVGLNNESIIVNGKSEMAGFDSFYSRRYYDDKKPLLLKIRDDKTLIESYSIYQDSKLKPITKSSTFRLTQPILLPDGKSFLYLKEHYNIPPSIVINRKGKEQNVYQTNVNDHRISEYRMEKICYTNSKGVPLIGLLYYPVKYENDKKYPMIVGIYEIMSHHYNRYLLDGFRGIQTEGMNIRYYLDRGYFVFLPDIEYDERGPGRSALDAVESSLKALEGKNGINFEKLGLLGHSHGGYQTNFIATQSKRFAAYVGGAGNADLVRSYHSFNYDYSIPFFWQFEEQQYRMYKSFAEAKNLYIDNSPVYHAEKVSSPILLWTGTKDENIEWEQTMEFYLSLRRNNKKVIALFYENEGHNMIKERNREDLYVKISDWFDYHLKGERKNWIERMNE